MPKIEIEPLLRPIEASRVSGLSRSTLLRWAKDGKITTYWTIGGHRRFLESEVREIARRRAHKPVFHFKRMSKARKRKLRPYTIARRQRSGQSRYVLAEDYRPSAIR